jgi:orotidine-5'-phosphate decarboxylase
VSQSFLAKLDDAVHRNNSLVCVGLDPDPAMMPVPAEEVAEFCAAIVEATSDLVCAYKPNIAFFEALAEPGWEALIKTLAVIPPDIPIIIDAKRGDIGNTAAAYARAIFEVLGADATTVNPYCGTDAVEPFFEYADKGVIVLCRSSNPSAVDFQDLEVDHLGTKRPLWQVVALKTREWNQKHGNAGLVVGATYPRQLAEARRLCPDMPILVPGIGAQEGALRDSVQAGLTRDRTGVIISASRSVLYASRDRDYALAARSATVQLREHVNRYREEGTNAGLIGERF